MGVYVPHLIGVIHSSLTRLAVGLHKPHLVSPSSLALVCGVAAVESDTGYYWHQFPSGPASGIFQMEPTTADDILRYLNERDSSDLDQWGTMREELEEAFRIYLPTKFADWHWLFTSNIGVAAAFCRLKFAMSPDPLPDAADTLGLANYWKKHYNTFDGKGKPDEFVAKFNLFIEPHLKSYVGK